MAILCTKTFTVPNCTYDTQISWTPASFDLLGVTGTSWYNVNDTLGSTAMPTVVNWDGPYSTSFFGFCTFSLPGVEQFNITAVADFNALGVTVFIGYCTDLVTISAPLVTDFGTIYIYTTPALQTISFPSLIASANTYLYFSYGPHLMTNLANVNLGNWIPNPTYDMDLSSAALTAASVNHILARFVAQPLWVNPLRVLNLSGGTSAAPTGQGILDKATLIGRGPSVLTN